MCAFRTRVKQPCRCGIDTFHKAPSQSRLIMSFLRCLTCGEILRFVGDLSAAVAFSQFCGPTLHAWPPQSQSARLGGRGTCRARETGCSGHLSGPRLPQQPRLLNSEERADLYLLCFSHSNAWYSMDHYQWGTGKLSHEIFIC